ncbi:hypothetical protein EYC84_002107 [Monilinia fructicola]|uniref:Uncharacterized protein n=1 Tax=Monilinia fructicola TaxID=38448 RepID=A0A5M9JVQ7_MONFR|nr:hypothetical protein EYC84_002107 [Monilinia fructicola]
MIQYHTIPYHTINSMPLNTNQTQPAADARIHKSISPTVKAYHVAQEHRDITIDQSQHSDRELLIHMMTPTPV